MSTHFIPEKQVAVSDSIPALNDFDQALILRQVSFLYHGHTVRSVEDIKFT